MRLMLTGMALLLGLLVLAELTMLGGTPQRAANRPTSARAGATASVVQPADWAATSLARPLFDPDRHRAADEGAGSLPGLPRLSGILVTPDRRHALFVTGDHTAVVDEGGRIGGYTVQSIATDRVVIQDGSGRHALRAEFDRSRADPAGAPALPTIIVPPPGPRSPLPRFTLPQPARPGTSR